MPKGTKVDSIYQAIKKKEMKKGSGKKKAQGKAARIAQSKTGKSLLTGKTPKKSADARKKRLADARF